DGSRANAPRARRPRRLQEHDRRQRRDDPQSDPRGDRGAPWPDSRRIRRQCEPLSCDHPRPGPGFRQDREDQPKVEVVYYDRLILDHTGDEKTAVRFTIGADGKVSDINTRPKSLIRETRKVRSNIPAT